MALREFKGGAKRTTLAAAITAASTTITVADATGYPTGATGPFAIALDVGLAGEEKVLIASRSGNTLTVATRGYDDTSASAHASATVDHIITATDIREANAHVNDTTTDVHPQYLTMAEGNAAYAPKAGKGVANYQAVAQTIAASTSVVLSFDDQAFSDGFNSAFPTRITAPSAGLYFAHAACAVQSLADQKRIQIQLLLNGVLQLGTTRDATQSGAVGTATTQTSRAFRLAAGDYLEARVFHDDTVSRNTDTARTSFSSIRIGD